MPIGLVGCRLLPAACRQSTTATDAPGPRPCPAPAEKTDTERKPSVPQPPSQLGSSEEEPEVGSQAGQAGRHLCRTIAICTTPGTTRHLPHALCPSQGPACSLTGRSNLLLTTWVLHHCRSWRWPFESLTGQPTTRALMWVLDGSLGARGCSIALLCLACVCPIDVCSTFTHCSLCCALVSKPLAASARQFAEPVLPYPAASSTHQ